MPTHTTNRSNERRDDRRREEPREGAEQPWDVFRLKEKTQRNGENRTEWLRCGVAWPMKDGKPGFNLDLEWAIPEGSRLAILPRKPQEER